MSDCDLQLVRPPGQCSIAMIEFTTAGTPRDISLAIEQYARATSRVNALVVPWESDATALSMAVTSVKADGWAIEHTDVGTIRLTAGTDGSTTVAIVARERASTTSLTRSRGCRPPIWNASAGAAATS